MSGDCMRFPDTVEEFMDQYKVVDREGIYMSKGSELVPIFRMDQWFEHEKAQLSQEGTTKGTTTDTISRQAAITALSHMCSEDEKGITVSRANVDSMLKSLPPTQPEQNWIPCTEQLPRQGQEVICQCRADMIKVLKLDAYGDWYQDATHCYMGGFVIAWMPLPEPYKEGGADVR